MSKRLTLGIILFLGSLAFTVLWIDAYLLRFTNSPVPGWLQLIPRFLPVEAAAIGIIGMLLGGTLMILFGSPKVTQLPITEKGELKPVKAAVKNYTVFNTATGEEIQDFKSAPEMEQFLRLRRMVNGPEPLEFREK